MPLLGRGGGLETLLPLPLLLPELLLDCRVVLPAVEVEVSFSALGTAVRVVSTGAGGSSTFFSVDGGLLKESFTFFSEVFCATLSLRLWIRSLDAAKVSLRTSWASLFFTSIVEDLLDWSSELICIPIVFIR